jgi:HSP20 family molecular chaperone IbpA
MAFSRFLSSSYRSFKAAVPTFIRRHPIVTTAVSYLGISYATRPLIRRFETNEENANADPLRPFPATDIFYPGRMLGRVMFSMIDHYINVRETDESIVLRYRLSDVRKEDVKVFVDHNVLKIEDAFPGRNRFRGTLDLAEKNCDGVHTTAKFENDVLEVVIPKKRKKNKEEDEDEVDVDLIVLHVIVE